VREEEEEGAGGREAKGRRRGVGFGSRRREEKRRERRRKGMKTHLNIRQRELNLPIDPSRSNKRRIERFNLVGGHDNLDVSSRVESIELIEKLEHRSLNFSFSS